MPRHNPDTSGYLLPVPVDDGTRICVKVVIPNQPAHRQAFIGAVSELTKAYNWASDADHTAILVANVWKAVFADMMQQFYENDCEGEGMACCYDVVEHRVTSDGKMQIRVNGGGWIDDPNDPRTTAVTFPPITLDAHHTKCDAASNVNEHFNDIISGTSEELGGAGSLVEIAIAIAAIIFALFIAPESIPALVPLILPLVAGLLFLGQAAWDAYFDSAARDKILCAIYCSIEDDGTFTAAGYAKLLGKLRTNLTAGPARDMFVDLVSRIGLVGMNDYAAIGTSADADCSACDCACEIDNWAVYSDNRPFAYGTELSRDASTITVQAVLDSVVTGFYGASITTGNKDVCCDVSITLGDGTTPQNANLKLDCGVDIPNNLAGSGWQVAGSTPYSDVSTLVVLSSAPITVIFHIG